MELSIVIPAYNEEARLDLTLRKIEEYLKSSKMINQWEILVIDDGSKDQTREIVKQHAAKEPRTKLNPSRENQGKGFSVREGALSAQFNTILFSDADLSTPIEELERFLPQLDNYDLIIGSRALRESSIAKHQPFYREFIGKTFNLLVRKITGLNLKDTQCGFKLFKNCRAIFEHQKMAGFSFDVELLYLANRNGKKILEMPVTWVNDERSKVSPVKDSYRMLRDLMKIKKMRRG